MMIHKLLTTWLFSRKALPYWCVLLLDCAIVMVSGYVGSYIDMGGMNFAQHFWPITWGLLVTLVLFVISFRIFHTYVGFVRYSSFVDLQKVAMASAAASAAACLLLLAVNALDADAVAGASEAQTASGTQVILLPSLVTILIIFTLSTLFMFMERVQVKRLFDTFRQDATTRKAFIYGVREGGIALAKSIQNQLPQQYSLAGFVSPDGDLQTNYLMGVKVRKDGTNLIKHMQKAGASVMIVSPLQTNRFRENEYLSNRLIEAGIKILIMPKAEEWDGKSELSHSQLREVEIEDLLPREKIEVNMDEIAVQLKGRSILITGAAGSIGSEIVRQVASFGPSQLVLVDQAETPMHDIRLMMHDRYPGVKAETIVVSITNHGYMERLFSDYRPEYVFHAAAYKHVPMMEDNPAVAIQNNVYGTRIIADLAVRYGTRKFVMVSTDKAVNPTNVMGCSKRICEIYCQSLNRAIADGRVQGCTQFVTTRFGNVLGSNGSVIPLFREQIKNGGPITVTHPDIIRYFMLIPEACKLVLEAATLGHGGEIFVFDMGKPVRIVDLANRMIALSGASDVKIEFTGLRDGEKLFEEVLAEKEKTKPTVNRKIFVAEVREYDYDEACRNEERLMELAGNGDKKEIVRFMKEVVPEYRSTNEKYNHLS